MQNSEDSHSVYRMVHSSGALLAVGHSGFSSVTIALDRFAATAIGRDGVGSDLCPASSNSLSPGSNLRMAKSGSPNELNRPKSHQVRARKNRGGLLLVAGYLKSAAPDRFRKLVTVVQLLES